MPAMICHNKAFVLSFLFVSLTAVSQQSATTEIESLSKSLITQIKNSISEQTFITTDKSLYAAGETVWLRVFLLRQPSQKINNRNKVVFIDMQDENNLSVMKLILRGTYDSLNGRFSLPDSLSTGQYWLRAYTKDMISGNELNNFIEEPIFVYNSRKKAVSKKEKKEFSENESPRVLFYPEGGSLITGVSVNVAVSTIDKNGIPFSAECSIRDNRDSLIARCITGKKGLGKFTFEPNRYRKYTALINLGGKLYSYPLPAFNPFAAQIAVAAQSDGSKNIRVLLEDSIYNKSFKTYLVAVSKDSVCFGSIGSGNYELAVREDKLPSGIVTFYLFNTNGKLLSERSIYIKERSQLTVQMNKPVYDKREKVIMDLSLMDADGLPLLTTLSLSVTNNQLVELPERNSTNPGNLTLPEDILYSEEETDLLMLSRKSNYNNLITHSQDITTSINNDSLLYIYGTVKDQKNIPLAGKPIVLSKTENSFWDIDTTDEKGKFCFRLTEYPDSTLFTVQSTTPENWVIDIDTIHIPRIKNEFVHYRKFGEGIREIPASLNIIPFEPPGKESLAPVTVFGIREIDALYKNKRASAFSYIIPASKIRENGTDNVSTAVLTAPGAQLLNGYLVFKGPSSMAGSPVSESSEPLVLVNGVPATVSSVGRSDIAASPVLNFLNTFDKHSIEFIEILSGPEAAVYGMRGGQGVIIINTRTTPEERAGIHKNIMSKTFYAKGYSHPVPFPSPVYDKKKKNLPENADQRSTIYWNPDILTDKEGKASVSFYTNDVPGKYVITIRGVTAHGDIINKQVSYILK
jgi:hypothetical protein